MGDATSYDFCIVGTGAAGGILAHQLASAGFKVISLEQGEALPETYFSEDNPAWTKKDFGLRPDTKFPLDPHRAIFEHELFATDGTRSTTEASQKNFEHYQIIKLNGLQNLWNGVSVRFGPKDFADWPITYDDLAPDYGAVEKLITVCGTIEGLDDLPDGEFVPPKPMRPPDQLVIDAIHKIDPHGTDIIANRKAIETRAESPQHCVSLGLCTSGCAQGSIYKFSTRLLPEIENLKNYTLRINSKVVSLIRDKDTNRIIDLEGIDTKSGKKFNIKADKYILSAGAVETPRILFNSQDDGFTDGLANSSGSVGRNLQDNPKVAASSSLYKLWGTKAQYDVGYGDLLIALSRAKLDDGSDFNFIGHVIHTFPYTPFYLEGFGMIPKFLRPFFARLMYKSYVTVAFFAPAEAVETNRIVLCDEVDDYGVKKVDIQFKQPPRSRAMQEKMITFAKKIIRKASGTLILGGIDDAGTGIHYAGTCRMSAEADKGVVNRDLQAHDHENLYICDGGVIPVLPDKHLTLTIMALAHRLAGHLIATSSRKSS